MGFLIRINGAERNAYTRWRTLRIQKDGAFEQAWIEFLDPDVSTAAFRPVDGDTLHILQDGGLEYGGEVVAVRDERLDGGRGGGTVTVVESRGWMFEADDIIVTASFPAQGLLDTAQAIFTTYLAPKGWTNNGAPSGGPALPALTYVRQSIRAIFDDLQKRGGWPWRVNGDKFGGFHLPGSITTPVNFSDAGTSVVLRGMNWKRDRVRHASRLYVTTGGTGEITYTDQMVGNGVVTTFPLRVEPKDKTPPTEVTEGGVKHQIGAGRWTFRANDPAIIANTPVGAGVAVSVAFQVVYPATVRVWDPPVQLASGAWNYAAVRDAVIQASDQTDIAQALTWATAELANRLASPKEVALSTYVQGFYPWQRAILTFPDRLINGAYMVQSTTLTDTGRKDQKPRIDLTLLEGDAIGRDWTAYFRERAGTSGGGGSVVTGGAGGGTTPGTGGVGLPPGTTFRLGGDNETAYAYPPATATPPANWRDGPQAVPTQLGGPGMAGAWTFRVPAFLLSPGLLTIRLLDQTAGVALATVATSRVGTLLSGNFEYLSVNFSAPAAVHDLLLQAQSASGVIDAVIGQTTIVKL